MCSNPGTYEFRLLLDLPQQSAVPTDTFSALREVHEYSAENGPCFHTAAEMFDSLGEYDRSRHENINVWRDLVLSLLSCRTLRRAWPRCCCLPDRARKRRNRSVRSSATNAW